MYSRAVFRLFLLVTFLLAFAAATCTKPTTTVTVTVTPTATSVPASQCNTGDLQCCNSLARADDSAVGLLLGLLGIVIQGVEALVGITCSPINILGIGQNECAAHPVCCQNNAVGGLISIGCIPITITL